ncbi:MAG: hypothetical protein GX080_04600 [Tissierellia bacterium]|nr:hypothetical protein [Tissierellia bacterium]
MKKFYYRYKTKKLIGLALAIIGCLIVINVLPVEFLLLLIGLLLIILGVLILK